MNASRLEAWGEQPPLFVQLLGAEVARSNMTKTGQRIGMSRTAVSLLPQPQPVSRAVTSPRRNKPSAAQWPKTTWVLTVRRFGASNQGTRPFGWLPGGPEKFKSSRPRRSQ